MTSATDNPYRIERGDAGADRERILALWERCNFLLGESARERYDWFYLANPAGTSRVYLLMHGDNLVGALGTGTRQFAGACGSVRSGAILVDFVVEPAHRSFSPALALQRAARAQELHDLPLVYGIPAAKAMPIFRRVGANLELPCGDYVRVLHASRYLRRLLPWMPTLALRAIGGVIDRARLALAWLVCRLAGVSAEWQNGPPENLEQLVEAVHDRDDCATGVRDRGFLQWRFDNSRGTHWRWLCVTGRRGRLIGCFIGAIEDGELLVHDFLVDHADHSYAALQALALGARRLRVEAVRFPFGGCARMQRTLARAEYLLREKRTCFLALAPGLDPQSIPKHWWLTRADEDV